MAEMTQAVKDRADALRNEDISESDSMATELQNIYNRYSGKERSDSCLCTPSKRNKFKTKFYDWYDFR